MNKDAQRYGIFQSIELFSMEILESRSVVPAAALHLMMIQSWLDGKMDSSDVSTVPLNKFAGKLQMPIEVVSQLFMLMLTTFSQEEKMVQFVFGPEQIENCWFNLMVSKIQNIVSY